VCTTILAYNRGFLGGVSKKAEVDSDQIGVEKQRQYSGKISFELGLG
jgi:hypothetical protein